MKHTKESLAKYANDKQMFFCEDDGKLLRSHDLKDYPDNATIYPVLRTALEIGRDIPFEQAHVNPAIAKSLWAICAGAFPRSDSPTGYMSFDGLPCKTPTQIEQYLKRFREQLSMKTTGPLIRVYEACLKFLQQCDEEDFKKQSIMDMANACRELEEVSG